MRGSGKQKKASTSWLEDLASRCAASLTSASDSQQQQAPLLSIIVPTFNERDNIEPLLSLLDRHLRAITDDAAGAAAWPHRDGQQQQHWWWWWEVVFVDDASADGTAELVQALQRRAGVLAPRAAAPSPAQQQHPHCSCGSVWCSGVSVGSNVTLVRRSGKLGLGTAYAAGLRQARGDWAVLMDADLSHHPKYLADMLRKQASTRCDVVASTRYTAGGGVTGWNWKRKLTSRGANLLAATLLGATQSDLTGAYRLYRRTCLQTLLEETTCRGYAFQMEVAVRAQAHGFHVEEVPIVFVDRLYGVSKLGPEEFIGFLQGLRQLLWTC